MFWLFAWVMALCNVFVLGFFFFFFGNSTNLCFDKIVFVNIDVMIYSIQFTSYLMQIFGFCFFYEWIYNLCDYFTYKFITKIGFYNLRSTIPLFWSHIGFDFDNLDCKQISE